MAKGAYIGVDGKARKIKKGYIGVENFVPRALPEGYTQLSHIEATGVQYFNTGYKAVSENYRIKCRFTVVNAGANTVLFGGGASTDIISAMLTSDSNLKFYVGSGSVAGALSPFEVGTEYEMECHANNGTLTVKLNGVSRSGSYSGTINKDYPLFIFANNASGSASQHSSVRFSEFQIYDNGNLVRDYVNCKNASGVVGLRDMVNGTFGGSASSTAFVAGDTYESVARKIKKAYIGIGGVARPFWSGGELAYYGTITALSLGRGYLSATSVGNYALFGGGRNYNDTGTACDTVDAYNTSLVRSTPSGTLTSKRYELAATTIGNYALFAGGYQSGGVITVDSYNTSLTRGGGSLAQARYRLAATTVGNYAIFGGGYYGSSARNNVDFFDTSGSRYSTSTLSVARYNLGATTIGDYALFGGGTNPDGGSTTVDAYNSSLTRSTPTALSEGRSPIGATSNGKYALFAGGTKKATVDAYDSSLTRSTPTVLSSGRYGFGATRVGNYALFGGGLTSSSSYTNVVDVYDESLTHTVAENLNVIRGNLAATTIGNYALFGGGRNASDADIATVDVFTVA